MEENQVSESAAPQHTLLLVDDEKNILNALRRLFYREPYKILMTTNPIEALQMVKDQPVSVIISDHRMPEMEGTKLLSKVRELNPDTIRIMLTGYADMSAATSAINDGRVYRFISKPWNDDALKGVVKEALRQYDLVHLNRELTDLVKEQNQELYDINRNLEAKVQERTQDLEAANKKLEESFLDTIKLLTDVLEIKDKTLAGHARRVAGQVTKVAEALGLPEKEQRVCEMTALLMDIGMIGYPRHLIETEPQDLDMRDRVIWEKHPLIAEATLKVIPRLKSVSHIIRCHHERYDGEGFPDGLWQDRIPFPARIIAAADYYDYLINPVNGKTGYSSTNALLRIEQEQGKRLDPKVVHALIDVIKNLHSPVSLNEIEVSLEDLKEGMILARDLKTGGGIFLIPAGNQLQVAHLERINNFHHIDPIIDRIYIYREEDAL